jgi:hypothetical protein
MLRRLHEDRNQHYRDLDCFCWHDGKIMARFKEQPQLCSCLGCGNIRRNIRGQQGLTLQERKECEAEKAEEEIIFHQGV